MIFLKNSYHANIGHYKQNLMQSFVRNVGKILKSCVSWHSIMTWLHNISPQLDSNAASDTLRIRLLSADDHIVPINLLFTFHFDIFLY